MSTTVFGEVITFPTIAEIETAPASKQMKYLFAAMRAAQQAGELASNGKPATTPITKATTSGSAFVAFPSVVAKRVTVINTTGTQIDVRYGTGGEYISLPDGSGNTFAVTANANELRVSRHDGGAVVDVKATVEI